jgi:6-pyruvoyl-tetrahydropterin synthase
MLSNFIVDIQNKTDLLTLIFITTGDSGPFLISKFYEIGLRFTCLELDSEGRGINFSRVKTMIQNIVKKFNNKIIVEKDSNAYELVKDREENFLVEFFGGLYFRIPDSAATFINQRNQEDTFEDILAANIKLLIEEEFAEPGEYEIIITESKKQWRRKIYRYINH